MVERYDPKAIEPKWQRIWADEHTWEVSNDEADFQSKYYVLEMLPYASGEPHIGHLKNYALGDAIAHFQRRHGHPEALVFLVQQPIPRDLSTLDDDVVRHRRIEAELLLVTGDTHVLLIEHERADPARARGLGISAREQQERPGMPAVRDPLFRTSDRPAVPGRLGLRPEGAGIRAGLRLRQRECA